MKKFIQILKENTQSTRRFSFNLKTVNEFKFLEFLNGKEILYIHRLPIKNQTVLIIFEDFTQLKFYEKNMDVSRKAQSNTFPDGRQFKVKDFEVWIDAVGNFFGYTVKLASDCVLTFHEEDMNYEMIYQSLSRDSILKFLEYVENEFGKLSAHEKLKLMARIPR